MDEKQKKLCLILTIITLVFCSSGVFAQQLEVSYPTVMEASITAQSSLPDFALYFFKFGLALGLFIVFLSLIISGVMYMFSPAKPDLVAQAKERALGSISGLLILVSSYLVITTLNPQLSVFQMTPVENPQIEVEKREDPGVYLYNTTGCPDGEENQQDHAIYKGTKSSIFDLGFYKNKIKSVKFVRNQQTGSAFVAILYENANLSGRCQYLNPNTPCHSAGSFAASVSIHSYDFSPSDDGVYFFRKTCFNNQATLNINNLISFCKENSGGYLKVANSDIGGIYFKSLDELKFTDVPEAEKICTSYSSAGECTERDSQKLSGENISSIIINGKYRVVLIYFDPKAETSQATSNQIWSACQEFPTPKDSSGLGPQQIKWEDIRNEEGVVPNYVVIIPVE